MAFDIQYAKRIARGVLANRSNILLADCAESWLLMLDQLHPDINSVDLLIARMESAENKMGTVEYEMYLFAKSWRGWLIDTES